MKKYFYIILILLLSLIGFNFFITNKANTNIYNKELYYKELKPAQQQWVNDKGIGIYLFKYKQSKLGTNKYLVYSRKKLEYNFQKSKVVEKDGLLSVYIDNEDALNDGEARDNLFLYIESNKTVNTLKLYLNGKETNFTEIYQE